MPNRAGKSEVIIEDIAGCGKFQVIISLCVYFLANSSPVFTMMFMSFGNYNPGWTCMQMNSSNIHNESIRFTQEFYNGQTSTTELPSDSILQDKIHVDNNGTSENEEDKCKVFDSCERIVFDSESSTIVSEWGLVCGRKWIPSIILSIQMAGIMMGCLFAGHLGDAIGRKRTIYGALFIMTCFNFVSIFSSSWQMFAALRFFLGVSNACVMVLYYIFTAEFVKKRWRSILQGIPAWSVSTILFAITCMCTRDWRYVHVVTVVLGIIGMIPAIWIPESLRWLEVKSKGANFEKVAIKIVRTNGKVLPSMEDIGKMASGEKLDVKKPVRKYNVLHLFKRGYKLYTVLLTVPWFIGSLIDDALGFGIKAMHGNFYLNLIISSFVDIPFAILPIILPNLLGRKLSGLIFAGVTGICLLGASCLDRLASGRLKSLGMVILIFTGKVSIDGLWCVLAIITLEIYPTVVRGIGTSWGMAVTRIGGVIAPFLIPEDHNTVFISYTVMGVLSFVCCVFLLGLPETKGKPLKRSFESEEELPFEDVE